MPDLLKSKTFKYLLQSKHAQLFKMESELKSTQAIFKNWLLKLFL